MPPRGHRTVTISQETFLLIEALRQSFPLDVSQGEAVRSALLVLFDQKHPLEAIAKAKKRSQQGTGAKTV